MYKMTNSSGIIRLADGALIPADPANADYRSYLDWEAEGNVISPAAAATQAEIIATYERALDDHLDSAARAHRYNDRFTFALRAGYPGPFHAEAVVFAAWMEDCNVQAFQLLEDVQSGTATLPSVEDFIASFPALVLP